MVVVVPAAQRRPMRGDGLHVGLQISASPPQLLPPVLIFSSSHLLLVISWKPMVKQTLIQDETYPSPHPRQKLLQQLDIFEGRGGMKE